MAQPLYPPNIAGTLPSFYTHEDGTTYIVVPFSMNSSVSQAAVSGITMRIKTTTTDTLVGTIRTGDTSYEGSSWTTTQAIFAIGENSDIQKRLVTGNFYKIQIAYYQMSTSGVITDGYYSTAAIIKYTERPSIIIQGLDLFSPTTVLGRYFTGQYSNSDISEKVYQYRFVITEIVAGQIAGDTSTRVFLDTGWLIHDSSQDTVLDSSVDVLELNTLLTTGVSYKISYSVITNNGLELTLGGQGFYDVIAATNVGETLNISIYSTLDYENGRMQIKLQPYDRDVNFDGNYYLQRTDSHSNFSTWIVIYSFYSEGKISEFNYYDYTIESGVAYKYGLQRINNANVLSQRAQSSTAIASYFEDCFLFDGEKQLKIQFNTNISSFKEVISETKKTTLGSKYPYIFRNGLLSYKEFPIQGLLTYLADKDELFITKEELLHPELLKYRYRQNNGLTDKTAYRIGNSTELSKDFVETTDQNDENVTAERNFAMAVLDWLNNGKIKLFKSSQEGNFIVKLLNVQLQPFNNTNRMIHQFSCTADEVQPFTPEALLKYDIMSTGTANKEGYSPEIRTRIIDLRANDGPYEKAKAKYAFSDNDKSRFPEFINYLTSLDLTDGYPTSKITIYDGTPGDLYRWGTFTFALGLDGTYTVELDEPTIQGLYIQKNDTDGRNLEYLQGKIALTYEVNKTVTIDEVNTQTVVNYLGWSGYGTDYDIYDTYGQTRNIIEDFASNKYIVSKCFSYAIHSYPVYSHNDLMSVNLATRQRWVLEYGSYVDFFDANTGLYYKLNSDATWSEPFASRDLKIRTNNSPTLTDVTQEGTNSSDVTSIDWLDRTKIQWSISKDMFVTLYLQVQKMDYALETSGIEINNERKAALDTKEIWLMYLFNFERVFQKPESINTKIFIYSNERFSQIPVNAWDNYDDYNIYKVYDGTYEKSLITTAYQTYRNAEQALESHIDRLIGG